MDIEKMRATITERWHRRHGELARRAGISRRSVVRIATEPGYLPSLRTFIALEREVGGWRKKRVDPVERSGAE